MSDPYFVIVKFQDTEEIEVTTSCWLREGGKKCVWPNFKSSNRTVKAASLHEAAKSDWLVYDIKIAGNGHKFGKLT